MGERTMNSAIQHRRRNRAGLTLVEAVMSCLVVSILLVAALRAAGAASVYQFKTADRARARFLAGQIITDILSLNYQNPTSPVFGRETGEVATSKTNYNDVDDFNGWSESPPQERDGTAMSELGAWQRSVVVEWVGNSAPNVVS